MAETACLVKPWTLHIPDGLICTRKFYYRLQAFFHLCIHWLKTARIPLKHYYWMGLTEFWLRGVFFLLVSYVDAAKRRSLQVRMSPLLRYLSNETIQAPWGFPRRISPWNPGGDWWVRGGSIIASQYIICRICRSIDSQLHRYIFLLVKSEILCHIIHHYPPWN